MIFDIITFVIAVASFSISIWNFVEVRVQSRANLFVECKDFIINTELQRQPLYIALSIINKSRLPLAVARAFVTIHGETFEFSWIPQVVHHARFGTSKETFDRTVVKSVAPPLDLAALSANGGYFYTETFGRINEHDIKDSLATVTLHTNRGVKKYQIKLCTITTDI